LVRFPRATRFLSFDVALAALEPGFAAVADADADADERRLATQLDIGSEAAAPSAERLSSAKTGRGRRGETLGLGFWEGRAVASRVEATGAFGVLRSSN
jgi:hypothetical protein